MKTKMNVSVDISRDLYYNGLLDEHEAFLKEQGKYDELMMLKQFRVSCWEHEQHPVTH